jgi:GNAT superfamily N-acetyltransferase
MLQLKLFVYRVINGFLLAMKQWKWLRLTFSISTKPEARLLDGVWRDGISVNVGCGRFFAGRVWLTYGAFYFEGGNYAVAYSLFVHPVFRRFGVGQLLLLKCLSVAKEHGFHELFLACTTHNEHGLRLYKKMGFLSFTASTNHSFYEKELQRFSNSPMVGFYMVCR